MSSGETVFLITTLRSFGQDGLAAALRALGRVDEVTVLDQPSDGANNSVSLRKVEKPDYLPDSTGLTTLTVLAPKVRFGRSLLESVQLADANALLAAVEKAASVQGGSRWISLPSKPAELLSMDPFSDTASLKSLADAPSVSGHERDVRERIIAALPAWARQKATTDSAGNIVVEVGPNRDAVMFIAHQDEVGFETTSIADDGTVSLRTRGGMFQSLWEGQPALLHFDQPGKEPLHGVLFQRDNANTKQPEATTAWFGVDGATLKRLGVVVGQSVTADKHATRLAATRFTARALDDRAGSTALILAARKSTPRSKTQANSFVAVREETGLEGAIVRLGVMRHPSNGCSVSTPFVSSDSPAESQRFAYARLGRGAVIRRIG